MARITKDPEERRNEIIETAMELFNAKGYEHTAVSDIVKKIGVAQGTFYYHFKSKEEIAEAVIDRYLAEQIVIANKIVTDPDLHAIDKLLSLMHEQLTSMASYRGIKEYVNKESNALLHQKLLIKKITSYVPFLTSIVEQGIKEGVFQVSNPQVVSEFLLIGTHFMFDVGFFQWSQEEFINKLKAMGEITEKLLGTNIYVDEEKSFIKAAKKLFFAQENGK